MHCLVLFFRRALGTVRCRVCAQLRRSVRGGELHDEYTSPFGEMYSDLSGYETHGQCVREEGLRVVLLMHTLIWEFDKVEQRGGGVKEVMSVCMFVLVRFERTRSLLGRGKMPGYKGSTCSLRACLCWFACRVAANVNIAAQCPFALSTRL